MKKLELRPEKFCKHGMGIEFCCTKGVHEVPWDKRLQAYIWPLRRTRSKRQRKR